MGSVVAGVVIKVGGVVVLVFKTPALGSSVYVLLYFPPVPLVTLALRCRPRLI